MKKEVMTINLSFKIKIPVEKDECGRRKNPMLALGRYIDGFFGDLRINQNYVHEYEEHGCLMPENEWNYPLKYLEGSEEKFGKVSAETLPYFKDEHARLLRLERVHNAGLQRRKVFNKESEEGCQRLFKMSYKDFEKLSWADRGQLKKDAQVEFDYITGEFKKWTKA